MNDTTVNCDNGLSIVVFIDNDEGDNLYISGNFAQVIFHHVSTDHPNVYFDKTLNSKKITRRNYKS
jgi:hypothetical protein